MFCPVVNIITCFHYADECFFSCLLIFLLLNKLKKELIEYLFQD